MNMKTYDELADIIKQNKTVLIQLFRQAHSASLQDDQPEKDCSVVAIGRRDGQIMQEIISVDEHRDEWYILAAYPHANPIETVVLYADEKAAILSNWCLEQGAMAPEQGEEEGDVAYLARLVSWIRINMAASAGEILTELIRNQLLADFDAEAEWQEAFSELKDLARGVDRRLPPDDAPEEGQDDGAAQRLAVPPELIRFASLDQGEHENEGQAEEQRNSD